MLLGTVCTGCHTNAATGAFEVAGTHLYACCHLKSAVVCCGVQPSPLPLEEVPERLSEAEAAHIVLLVRVGA